jgi:nucleoside-diphosphate-sugar epimerase
VTNPEACRHAVDGVDAIIHTAAHAGVWGPAKEFELANVVATTNLIDAGLKRRIRAFVHTSSPSVTFDGTAQCNMDESAPYPKRWLCHYPRTKAISEQSVLAANQSDSMLTCALRPHLIWGVGDPHLIPRVIDRCRTGRLRCVGSGRNLIDTVHVELAAAAHRLALEHLMERDSQASGRAYFITDGQPIACWDWISQILSCAGLETPRRRISLAAAYRIGHLLELIYRIFRIRREPPMTRFVASQLGVDHYFNIHSARDKLGIQPLSNREQRIEELRHSLALK